MNLADLLFNSDTRDCVTHEDGEYFINYDEILVDTGRGLMKFRYKGKDVSEQDIERFTVGDTLYIQKLQGKIPVEIMG